MTAVVLDLTGVRFGRLVAQSRQVVSKKSFWTCLCDCGQETSVFIGNLRSGSIKSCGCLRREVLDKTTHGLSATPEYQTWVGMVARCTNPKAEKYMDYGGRGIRVCERWLNVEDFYADMAPKPEGLTLGRHDNDGDYTPDNCSWETDEEQDNNKRTTRRLTHDGRTMSMAQWAREIGMPIETLFSRLKTNSVADALTMQGRRK